MSNFSISQSVFKSLKPQTCKDQDLNFLERIKSLSDVKILGKIELKAFADDNLLVVQIIGNDDFCLW